VGRLAAQTVAHSHGQARACFAIAQHLEVVIEAGHLVHLGHRDVHLGRQRHQQHLGQAVVRVVEGV